MSDSKPAAEKEKGRFLRGKLSQLGTPRSTPCPHNPLTHGPTAAAPRHGHRRRGTIMPCL